MSRVDPDYMYLVSISWTEARAPYIGGNPDRKPLLDFGKVFRYESEEDAYEAMRRLSIERTWAPKWAIDSDVGGPSRVMREHSERERLKQYLANLDGGA